MKVYETVAAGVAVEGPEKIFGPMGDGNMSLWATFIMRSGVKLQ